MRSYVNQVRNFLTRSPIVVTFELYETFEEALLPVSRGRIWGYVAWGDGAELHFSEQLPTTMRKYRFQRMDGHKQLICRWDSAPHHLEVDAAPFHVHTPDGIKSSPPMTLLTVLIQIEETALRSMRETGAF